MGVVWRSLHALCIGFFSLFFHCLDATFDATFIPPTATV